MQQTGIFTGMNRPPASIDPAAEVGIVTLKVADLKRSLAFYTDLIGLSRLAQAAHTALLGAGDRPILRLEEVPGARPASPRATGLYHAAILLPSRRALARKVAQLANAGVSLGQGDHLVSEAFYLADPDGNGLELYRDRPRAEWQWEGGQVRMASDPIDLAGMWAEIGDDAAALEDVRMPAGTKLGHMHLRVSDVAQAERFYHDVLGFDVTARWPGAVFLSAGGYHHHLGLNMWESRGGKPPVEPSAGLREFSIVLPGQAARDTLAQRIEAAGTATEREADGGITVYDPFQNRIRLVIATEGAADRA
jgi:catechol 2,3-dioxygenase